MVRVLPMIVRVIVICGIVVALQLPLASVLHAEEASITDTPVPVVLDSVEVWSVGSGLIYWAYSCFGDEFVSTAALKRRPVSGGLIRTIESIDDSARCETYLNQLSSDDGLTFYDASGKRLARMPLGEPFVAQEVKSLANDQLPVASLPLKEANGYLYWIGFQRISRTLKDGSGPVEIVVSAPSLVTDMVIVGSTVYWIDNGGMKRISISCNVLPCTDTMSTLHPFDANTRGHGLVYRPPTGGPVFNSPFRLYWVEHSTTVPTTYRIRYCSVSLIVPCDDPVVLPVEGGGLSSPAAVKNFYTATTNWYIGYPILVNGTLYWTERDASNLTNNTGDVKRKASAAADVDPAETIATNQSKIDGLLFAANGLIFFARNHTGIYSLALTASAITRDFEASALEVTQAIQNLANSAPLIAQKTTFVRAYGKQLDGPSTPNVEARLFGTRNGADLPGSPLQAFNGARALTTGAGFDRARLDDGWYFQLPASWLKAGQVALKFEIDGRRIHTDPNLGNNEVSKTVTFQNQPPVCVWTVPVRTHTALPATTDPNFWTMVSHFNRRWPVPDTWIFRDTDPVEELQVCFAGPVPYPCHGPYELEDGWGVTNGPPDRDKVIISLWGRALLSFNPDACDDISAPVHFMGMVHPDANNGGASGYASTISNQSWVQLPAHLPNPVAAGWNMLREGSVMAQELAHNHGRKHVNCNNPDNIDSGYPYPPCQIADVGAESYYGFDVTTLQPLRPDQTADFMSYANNTWVSDYTWRALTSSFVTANGLSVPASPDAAESVFVTGLVDSDHARGEISTVLVLPTTSVPPSTAQSLAVGQLAGADNVPSQTTFKLRLLDSADSVLVERVLTVVPMDDHTPDGASALFGDLFAKPAGQVAKIQLVAGNSVIDEIVPGTSKPTVSVSQPAGGTMVEDSLTIAWSADDPDPGDQLLFTIQYSHNNGAKWHTIAINYPSNPDKSYLLTLSDLGGLSGSAPNQALIRVLASDGYNTSIGLSQPFTVKNRTPEPVILMPLTDQSFAAAVTIPLSGQATDPEDGGLSGSSLTWKVDASTIGVGSEVHVDGLAPGVHTAQLKAEDSNGNTASVSADFKIAPLSVPASAASPLMDGLCDDGSYALGQPVALRPYADGSQTTVRLLRTSDYLWACFFGMKKGAENPGSFTALRVDVDNSRHDLAQSDDYLFLVGEDGDVAAYAGNGAGGFSNPGPGGLIGQMQSGPVHWSAELRIDKAVLGGWDHLVGLSFGHFQLEGADDDYVWPYSAAKNRPVTWATSALGIQPLLTALEPFTAAVNSAPLVLHVEGSGLIDGTTVLWNGMPLATTFLDEEHLTAQIGAAQLANAGVVGVKARGPSGFESNSLTFVVEPPAPIVDSLSPATLQAGGPATTMTVKGDHFASDVEVLWNGTPLVTQFENAKQVKVQLSAAMIEDGQTAGVAVRNQSPIQRTSNALPFEVLPEQTEPARQIFVPMTMQ